MRIEAPSRFCIAAGVVLLAIGSSSCASSSGGELARKANAICARYKRQAEAIPEPAPEKATGAQAAAAALRILRREFADLRKLRAPADKRKAYERFLAAEEAEIGLIEEQRRYFAKEEPRLYAAIARAKPRRAKPTAQDIEHPTAAILSQLASLPEYRRFVRHVNALVRRGEPLEHEYRKAARALGLHACVESSEHR